MDKLERVKAASEDKKKVLAWLDHIQEFDKDCRAEVIEQCTIDKEAREYYVSRANESLS